MTQTDQISALRPDTDAAVASPAPPVQTAATALGLQSISKVFGDTSVVRDVTVDFPKGQFTVLLGPSGCGKSTLLRMIAGLELPSAGQITLEGRDITQAAPASRGISMVFQSYALFPHLTVAQNILFGLQVRRVGRADQAARLETVARMMGLTPLLDRRPSQLSGGQQQRVALARAVISERPVCLMDEPLSNLDAKLRAEMRTEIRALHQRLGLTMIYVTHDQVEAMTMADQIVILNEGQIQQVGSPRDVYARPETAFCARFIGTPPMNLLTLSDLPAERWAHLQHLAPDTLVGLRPEDISTGTPRGTAATVTGVEYLGADQLVSCQIGQASLLVRQPVRHGAPGGQVHVDWAAEALHLFDPLSGKRLRA